MNDTLDTALSMTQIRYAKACDALWRAIVLNQILEHQDLSAQAVESLRRATREVQEAMGYGV